MLQLCDCKSTRFPRTSFRIRRCYHHHHNPAHNPPHHLVRTSLADETNPTVYPSGQPPSHHHYPQATTTLKRQETGYEKKNGCLAHTYAHILSLGKTFCRLGTSLIQRTLIGSRAHAAGGGVGRGGKGRLKRTVSVETTYVVGLS